MKRKARRRRMSKFFTLPQIMEMQPYVFLLMKDLRACRIRERQLRRLVAKRHPDDGYEVRRRRHEANAELEGIRRESMSIRREFRNLGVHIGDVIRGEMLFPAIVSRRKALFVWYDGQHRPGHWRYEDEDELRAIPERWFSVATFDASGLHTTDWR